MSSSSVSRRESARDMIRTSSSSRSTTRPTEVADSSSSTAAAGAARLSARDMIRTSSSSRSTTRPTEVADSSRSAAAAGTARLSARDMIRTSSSSRSTTRPTEVADSSSSTAAAGAARLSARDMIRSSSSAHSTTKSTAPGHTKPLSGISELSVETSEASQGSGIDNIMSQLGLTEDLGQAPVDVNGRVTKSYTAKICFLMDMTGSMEPQRDAVLEKIGELIDKSLEEFPNVAIEYGLVGYRDVDAPSSARYVLIPFSSDLGYFTSELGRCECNWGDDEAEDVLGGMEYALKRLDWTGSRIKLLFHVGDSPHHGHIFADAAAGGCHDRHTDLECSPRPYRDILHDFSDSHIDYYFALVRNPRGEIKTRHMAELFKEAYDSCQSRKNPMQIVDLSSFSPDSLFGAVLEGLSSSIRSFVKNRR